MGSVSEDIYGNCSTLASHVLCFMVRGIRTNWKQLLAWYATGTSTPGEDLHYFYVYTVCQKNGHHILHEVLIDLTTSPVSCMHRTLGNPKNLFSTVLFIHTCDYLHYFRI